SQPARIVNVSSTAAYMFVPEGGIEFEKLNDPNSHNPRQRYSQSKFANILFTNELNKRLPEEIQVFANSLHPGIVDTPLLRRDDLSFPGNISTSSISSEDGAITILYCATSPEIEKKNYRGKYFEPFGIVVEKKSSYGDDNNLAKRLWEFTENLISEKLL
ncbi:7063_t:CDS:2, partial [Dentiscutata heterogama]